MLGNIGLAEIDSIVKEAINVDISTALLVNAPTAAAIIYVVRMFISEGRKEKEDIKGTLDRNTDALLKVAGAVSECKMIQNEHQEGE